MACAWFKTSFFSSISNSTYQLKTAAINTMLKHNDRKRWVRWHLQTTEQENHWHSGFNSEERFFYFTYSKSFRPCSVYSALPRRHTRLPVPHSIHKMTLAISPELKECARRPQPVTQCSGGNPLKTETSILELSLLLTSKKYDHIYTDWNPKGVKNKCTQSWAVLGGCWTSDIWSKEVKTRCKRIYFNINTCTSHNKSRQLQSQGKRGRGCLRLSRWGFVHVFFYLCPYGWSFLCETVPSCSKLYFIA